MALNRRPSELVGIRDPLEAYYFDLELLSRYYSEKRSRTVEEIMRKRAERRRKALEWRRRYIG